MSTEAGPTNSDSGHSTAEELGQPSSYGSVQHSADPFAYERLKTFAKRMRYAPTPAEERFWNAVRGGRLNGWKFRRQHPIASFIADFIHLESKLIIELDGGGHADPRQAQYDTQRSSRLAQMGYRVLRFPNPHIHERLPVVLQAIAQAITDTTSV